MFLFDLGDGLDGASTGSVSASYQNQKTTDHFASTGKVLSGLYAGDQGIGIDVAGNTNLTAGVVSSTVSREKNHFNTGSLEAHSFENSSAWKSQSVGFQAGAGSGMITGSLSQTLVGIGKGMAANSAGLLGGGRSHGESSESQSAISDTITVNAGHVTGAYSRDVDHANGALTNRFDAQKLQNQIQASQLGTQIVGEVMGRVSDELYSHGVQGFDEHSATNNWGRAILEAGGSAAVAAVTGGNVAATATSVFAGTVASGATRDWADRAATALTGQPSGGYGSQAKLHDSLMNLLSNGIASAAGAVGGLVAGPGNATANALNGASAASAIQQYNQAFEPPEREDIREVRGERNAETGELLSDVDVFNIETYKNNIKEIEDIDPGNPLLSRTQLVPPGTVHVPTDEEINEVVSAAELARYTLRENNNDKEATRVELERIRQGVIQARHEQSGKDIYQPIFPELEPPNFERGVLPKRLIDQNGVLDQNFTDPVVSRDPQNYDKNTSNNDSNTSLAEGGDSQGALPPWRDSNGDFIGEQRQKKKPALRTVPPSVDSKKAASDFYENSVKWFRENGFEVGKVEKVDINKEGETNSKKYLLKTPVLDENGEIISHIVRRTGEAASGRTEVTTHTVELDEHPDMYEGAGSVHVKIKFPQSEGK